jgi:deoxyadenosine/deoxycytidine kinase
MVYIFSIEGNIGSGKSTLVRVLSKNLHYIAHAPVIYVQEPVSEWDNIKDRDGKTILEKFYADQHKYAFSFQMMAYISSLALLKRVIKENPNAILITERSVFTDKEVFAKMLYDEGKIEEVNYQIYLKWFDEFIEDIPITGLIYINTTPEKSKERVDIRARPGENIQLEYLKQCHNYHTKWIDNFKKPVSLFDGNIDFIDSLDIQSLNKISSFILEHIKPKTHHVTDQYMYTKCTS